MARWLPLAGLISVLGLVVAGCAAPMRTVRPEPSMASAASHEATPARSATLDAHSSTPKYPRPPEGDGPTPEQAGRGKVLIASLIVLAAVVAILVSIH